MEHSIKEAHEKFVSSHEGSIAIEVLLAVLPIVPGSFLASSFSYMTSGKEIQDFCVQFILCVLPMILSFTIFNQILIEFNAVLFLLVVLRMAHLSNNVFKTSTSISTKGKQISSDKISFLTTCRATINLATIIAILAVDFHVFPRRFAKTEEFGYSLMDVGAPCYVLMNAITDSRSKIIPKHTTRNVLILLALGFARLFSVSLAHYQHHVTEYGLHANFFFILAFVKLACCWAPLLSTRLKLFSGILIAVTHQSNLNSGLSSWTLSQEPRNTFVTANREFIVSMPGYIEIYLFGSVLGDYLFQRNTNFRRLGLACAVPYVILFVLENIFGIQPSRRLANTSFVAWIMGFYLLFLNLFYLVEKFLYLTSPQRQQQIINSSKKEDSSSIFLVLMESVNNSSLLFFLLGNILTGIINLSVNTLEVTNGIAFLIVSSYALFLTFVVFLVDKLRKPIITLTSL